MKTIRIRLLHSNKFLDGYLYLGHLFFISKNGDVCSIPFDEIINKLNGLFPQYTQVLRLAFLRNDWLNNKQSGTIFGIPSIKEEFKKLWILASEKDFIVELDKDNITKHFVAPSMPIFDFKLYGLKLFMGHREGLHECQAFIKSNEFISFNKPVKIFEARTTSLSVKSGEVMISSNSDGLFRGTFAGINEKVRVLNKVLAPRSIRTGWSSFDVINYDQQSHFEYFQNETDTPEKGEQRLNRYSSEDESSEKTRITEFGVKNYSIEDLLSKSSLNPSQIKYSFNSSLFCFFLLNDGKLITSYLNKDKKENIYLRKKQHILSSSFEFSHPISSSIVPKGCILEFFDTLVLVRNQSSIILENEPTFAVKTFPTSRRFRNIILAFMDSGVAIHSMYPFDDSDLEDQLLVKDSDDLPF